MSACLKKTFQILHTTSNDIISLFFKTLLNICDHICYHAQFTFLFSIEGNVVERFNYVWPVLYVSFIYNLPLLQKGMVNPCQLQQLLSDLHLPNQKIPVHNQQSDNIYCQLHWFLALSQLKLNLSTLAQRDILGSKLNLQVIPVPSSTYIGIGS